MTAPQIVTVTVAGAIDATYRVAELRHGELMRAQSYMREVSGKGVNVSAALALAGHDTSAVVVLGEDDVEFARRSDPGGILQIVAIAGATRVNTAFIDDAGATTKVNSPAPAIPRDTWEAVVAATENMWGEVTSPHAEVAKARDASSWLVIAGTLPLVHGEKVRPDVAVLSERARARGVRVALDTSGQALADLVSDPHGITLIKPNAEELAELTGRSLQTISDVVEAAREVISRGLEAVYASLGADGVLVVTPTFTIHARAEARRVANTAGAGDASLAGFFVGLAGRALTDEDALADAAETAAVWGAHAVAHDKTVMSSLENLPIAFVTREPDAALPLREPAFV
ncbi:PfkB family carbohydrate kinase [Microbacterium sp. NPDC076911]|uniref:1-phosphofructokinase family hexose kinase n=1 Tax=Microbacterium sp. NPDC076911 TaxID=3154958 RepID=UPI00342D5825